jgi:hypothetical protein
MSTFAIALFVCASTAAAAPAKSSNPKAQAAKAQAEARRIVAGQEFRAAARSRDIARMNALLKGTGVVASEPVALFYCLPPEFANYTNGQWYCGGRVVEPFMYADW